MISFLNQTGLPRGLRNNNPGNLIITAYNWVGKIPVAENTDHVFEQFTTANYGIRAMAMDLLNDIGEGTKTLRQLITEYAPPTENNVVAYVNYVAGQLGVNPDAPLQINADALAQLIQAQIRMENGEQAAALIPYEEIKSSIRLMPQLLLKQLGDFASQHKAGVALVLVAAPLVAYGGYRLFKRLAA